MRILNLSNLYKQRPSELIGLDDPYTAFCFDEACLLIVNRKENGEEPIFDEDRPTIKTKYVSFSEMYGSMNLVTRGGIPIVR